MISLQISQLYFDVILFNQKILIVFRLLFKIIVLYHLGPVWYYSVFESTALSN